MSNATSDDPRLALVESRVRAIPDFPKPGILFRDITPVLAHRDSLTAALELHVERAKGFGKTPARVCGMESRGFLFGMAVAERLGAGFVPVRKPGKLPAETIEESYELEYGTDTLQIHVDAIEKGHDVLIIDDLLATGGTASTAVKLVQRLGGNVIGALFLVELEGLQGRSRLDDIPVESLLTY